MRFYDSQLKCFRNILYFFLEFLKEDLYGKGCCRVRANILSHDSSCKGPIGHFGDFQAGWGLS